MAEAAGDYKGIACPNCESVDNYSGAQNTKTTDCITRKKTCKHCGTIFTTVEVPVSILQVSNNHTTQK